MTRPQLVQIGVRRLADGSHIPIWAVMLGDTSNAEKVARMYGPFGPCSLNATLWTRPDGGPGWLMTTYRRPRNIDEAMDWYADSEAFISREQGDRSILPRRFGGMGAAVLSNVEFIIQYDDGTAKAYLYPGTSRSDADRAVASLDVLPVTSVQ